MYCSNPEVNITQILYEAFSKHRQQREPALEAAYENAQRHTDKFLLSR
jgi:hypothetical protein